MGTPSSFTNTTNNAKMVKAVATVRGDSKVSGTVTFEQASESSPTTITWDITGNDPNAERGMHVHQFGDNTNGCTSAGPHFNPHGKTHGAPTDETRHVGDLGNFKTDGQGNGKGSTTDKLIKLIGPESVIGRTVVVHSEPMISARAKTRSPRRLATPVLALLAVSLALLHRCIMINESLAKIESTR